MKKYKQLARCRMCDQRYVVDKDAYPSKYMASHYCKKCFKRYQRLQEKEREAKGK